MAHHVRIRVALAAMTVFATALAGCAGQPGDQQALNDPIPGDAGVTATDGYTESTTEADPSTPAARDEPATTRPATRRPAGQPAPRTDEPDAPEGSAAPGASEAPNAPEAPEPPAANDRTTRPLVTTGPPQPGRGSRPTTRPPVTTGPPQPPTTAPPPSTSAAPPPVTSAPPGLDVGPDECSEGNGLPPHEGFQDGGRCVDTQMGEVAGAADNPSLLITEAPERVGVNQPFTIRVSTRNLVRDRFLPAGQGGYYVDMSILTAQGLVRGHFHTACRVLDSTEVAPEPAPAPAFFVATEDSQGGREPDVIEIRVPGLPQAGTFQCSAWAGDASHRVPMMQRANQIPALDSVRVEVR